MPNFARAAVSLLLLLAAVASLPAQQSPAELAAGHLAKARTLAGMEFLGTEEIQCAELGASDPYAPTDKEDRVTPTRVFDNLYFIGTRTVGSWAVKTSQGIILVNALHSRWVNSTLISGLKKVGLDPADVKMVIVTQGEGDHFGGAKYFQDKYDAQVIMSAADWDWLGRMMPARGRGGRGDSTGIPGRTDRGGGGGGGGGFGGGRGGFSGGRSGGGMGGGRGSGGMGGRGSLPPKASEDADEEPRRDQVGVDGQTFTLGDETVTILLTPSYTPGSLSVLIPVTDHGERHLVALLGATEIPRSATMKNAYITSAKHLGEVAATAHVDIELNTRPFVDNAVARMDTLRKASAGAKNPFIIGTDGFQRYVGMIGECGWVNLLRPRESTQP